jgi:Holliday junction resolvasome RuvABC ATP-dependent DNA helicase subunit
MSKVRNCLSNVKKADSSARPGVLDAETAKVVYRPMPSSSSNFVGRMDYLDKLEAVFMQGRCQTGFRPVSVLCGPSGIGKTQLSVKFAETRSHL